MALIKCTKCGQMISDKASKCPKCGCLIEQGIEDVASHPSDKRESATGWNPKPLLYILIVILVAIISGLAVWYFTNSKGLADADEVEKTEGTSIAQSEEVKVQDDETSLSADDETFFKQQVENWDNMHNQQTYEDDGYTLYSNRVYYYGKNISVEDVVRSNQDFCLKNPDFWQESKNIQVTKITETRVVCDFDKHVHLNGESDIYRSYLFFVEERNGNWTIEEESDLVTDRNLKKKKKAVSGKIVHPLTSQFIREYCDGHNRPYDEWDEVKEEIRRGRLNEE